jgi:hypothetical protein
VHVLYRHRDRVDELGTVVVVGSLLMFSYVQIDIEIRSDELGTKVAFQKQIYTSFTELFAANDWKTFQSCFVQN